MLPPPYTVMPLLLKLSGKPLDGLYTAKDLSLKIKGKKSLGFLYLHFKRLYLLKQTVI